MDPTDINVPAGSLAKIGEFAWPLHLRDPRVMLFGGLTAYMAGVALSYNDPKKMHYPYVAFVIGAVTQSPVR